MTSGLQKTTERIGLALLLMVEALRYLPHVPRSASRITGYILHMGYQTLFIVALLSFFIGAVLALQAGFSMASISEFLYYLGSLVGLSMCRELAPVMTAFLVAGRVGSAMTAELASMKVYNEVDALNTMNIPPARLLVMPRLVAVLLVMPVLCIFSIVMGWVGGQITAQHVTGIGLDPHIYWVSLKEFVSFSDIIDGLIKAEIFGFLIVLICCSQGLNTQGGPREIGRSVTRAVVASMVAILIFDYFITKLTL